MRKKPVCVRLLRIYFGTLTQYFKKLFFPNKYKAFKTPKTTIPTTTDVGEQDKQDNATTDLSDGCVGCGCALIILWIIFAAVSWAWGIHWFFGVLMLFFMLAIFH